jgi:hypothetical protein
MARCGSILMARVVTAAQIGCVMLAQMLFVFTKPAPSTLAAHAPLRDCAAHHQCGCPAELTARKACCCFAGATESTPAPTAAGVVQKFIRAAHCGGATANDSTISKLDWALAPLPAPQRVDFRAEHVVAFVTAFCSRTVEPLVPPPKVVLEVIV